MAQKIIAYSGANYSISYEMLNLNATKDLVVLHGWGSNKELMRGAFGKHLSEFRHIYIDLAGFGASSSSVPLHTSDYADMVQIFLDSIGAKKDVVIGHSFGGKVATLLEPDLLVLLSSAGVRVPKSFKVRSKIAIFKALKVFGLASLRGFFASSDAKSLPPHMYETFKNVVDEDFSEIFASRDGKTLICWGESDTATPLSSGKEIAKLIKGSHFVSFEGDHYFFLAHAKEVAKHITRSSGESV